MKNLLIILIAFAPLLTFGQSHRYKWDGKRFNEKFFFFSAGLDPAAAISGTDKRPAGADLVFTLGVTDRRVRLAMFYERFEKIRFQSWGFQGGPVFEPFDAFKIIPGAELSMINRFGPTWITYAGFTQIEYHSPGVDRLFFYVKTELKRAPDVSQDWRWSNHAGVGFKF